MGAPQLRRNEQLDSGNTLPKHTLDGLAVTAACIARGLDIQLYPDQVLIASYPSDVATTLSFVQGVPHSVGLSEITFLQERPMRRNLHQRAGIPIPEGTSFTLRKGISNGRAFIEKLGFPVVLKPATGSASTEISPRIDDWDGFDAALATLESSPETRPGFVHMLAGPANTNWPQTDNGVSRPPPNYRVVVEKHLSGQYIRFLILHGEVKSAVHCTGGPWSADATDFSDVTTSVSDSVMSLAVQAVETLPRLPIAAVDMIVDDHKHELADQGAHIVEISERPWLYVQKQISHQLYQSLGDEIFRLHARRNAIEFDVVGAKRAITFSISGLRATTGIDGVEGSIVELARKNSLTGYVELLTGRTGPEELRGHIEGDPLCIAVFSETVLRGVPEGYKGIAIAGWNTPVRDIPSFTPPDS